MSRTDEPRVASTLKLLLIGVPGLILALAVTLVAGLYLFLTILQYLCWALPFMCRSY